MIGFFGVFCTLLSYNQENNLFFHELQTFHRSHFVNCGHHSDLI